eukprot:12844690-Alexandrium_andersonii.AAC.1
MNLPKMLQVVSACCAKRTSQGHEDIRLTAGLPGNATCPAGVRQCEWNWSGWGGRGVQGLSAFNHDVEPGSNHRNLQKSSAPLSARSA